MFYYDHVNNRVINSEQPALALAAWAVGGRMGDYHRATDGCVVETATNAEILTPMDFSRFTGTLAFEWEYENSIKAFMKPYTLDSVVGEGVSTADAAWDLWQKLTKEGN